MKKDGKVTMLDLEPEVVEKLESLAKKKGISLEECILEILEFNICKAERALGLRSD